MKTRLVFILLACLGLLADTSLASQVAVMGPQNYLRTTTGPNSFSASFFALPGAGTLIVESTNPENAGRVVAQILLNGQEVVAWHDNGAPGTKKVFSVSLVRANILTVELRGVPDAYITITVTEEITCTALDPCHVAGFWDRTIGECTNPAAADGTTCTDGNACTQSDTCQAGMCVGASPVICTAFDQCHVAGVCEPSSGTCSTPAAPDGTNCTDGNACTQTDSCQAGVCAGSNPMVCTALDQCHVAGVCEPGTGVCTNPASADGTACNDGNLCTVNDACQAGSCVSTCALACADDNNACTLETCDPTLGCLHVDQRTPLPIAQGLERYALTSPTGRVGLFGGGACEAWTGSYFDFGEPHDNYCGPTAAMNLLYWYNGQAPDEQGLWHQLGDEMRTDVWSEGQTTAQLVGACLASCGGLVFTEPVTAAACTAVCSSVMEAVVTAGTLPEDMEKGLAAHTPPGYQLIRKRGNPGRGAFEALLRQGTPITTLLWTGSTLHWTDVIGTYDSGGNVMVRFANHSDQTWNWFDHQWSLDGMTWPAERILGWNGIEDYTWMRYEKTTLLRPGQSLAAGQDNAIYSQDGRFMFFLDSAGHLVNYPTPLTLGTAVWHSGNSTVSDAVALGYYVIMQGDGNLVIYDGAGHAKWHTATHGHPGAYLSIQNDGNLVIYDADGHTVRWESHSGGHY